MASLPNAVPVGSGSLFRIGSQTKQFTALLALMLEADGKLCLADDVRRYLPWLPVYPGPISLHQLLANVGGLADFLDLLVLSGQSLETPSDRQKLRSIIAGHGIVNFAAGSDLMYCNTGFFLISEILEEVSGRSFDELLQERIAGPLGMADTRLMREDSEILPHLVDHHSRATDGSWRRAHWGLELGGEGGMVSTLRDMNLWLDNLDAPSVGTMTMIERMTAPGATIRNRQTPYGLGLVRRSYRGHLAIGHGGGVAGGVSESIRFPDQAFRVVLLANNDEISTYATVRRIFDIATGAALGPLISQAGQAQLIQASGLYAADDGELFGISQRAGDPIFVSCRSRMTIEEESDGLFAPERGILPLRLSLRGGDLIEANWFGHSKSFRRIEPSPWAADQIVGHYQSRELSMTAEISLSAGNFILKLITSYGLLTASLAPYELGICLVDRTVDQGIVTWDYVVRAVGDRIEISNDRVRGIVLYRSDAAVAFADQRFPT